MSTFFRALFLRLSISGLTWVARLFGLLGLFLLAVVVGIFGGLWSQSDRLTQAGLALTGLSLLDGNVKGSFYWIARGVLFALMLVFWVISCFAIVWLCRVGLGVKI